MTVKNFREKLGLGLTVLLTVFPFLYMLLAYTFHVPLGKMHNGAGIVSVVLLALLLLESKQFRQRPVQIRWMLISAGIFFGLTVIGQLLGFQDIRYYLSGLSNNGRYFVFFFACILFLKERWRDPMMKLWDILFWLNFLLSLYQFFVLGYSWDYLGGIFGVTTGCNAYTNVFFMVSTALSVLRYMDKREKAWLCLARCVAMLIVAAMAELKVYLVEFVMILALAVLLTKFSRQKVFLLIGGLIGAVAFVKLTVTIFPYLKNWFDLESMWKTLTSPTGYTGAGDWNRLTAVPIAWSEHLLTWPQKIFGLGLGNCDFSPIAGWSSPFYTEQYNTFYFLFSSGLIMLETGLVGTVAYVGFFLVIFWAAFRLMRSGRADTVYCQMTQILSLMCLVLYIYNCSLRTELGYMIYFAMALAFVGGADKE